ncbi:NGG1-interacting factor 3 [Astathelohania contejeani]|uniref:NGG1-interacting factor 3 n=1 Tax=Astathelohania contejeani TaxID=164912 RepID=A0ABQ7I0S2_9MICR|nr:NGG1-interacting factor 3 [Thelohania contejeani]
MDLIVEAFETFAPLCNADHSWDNVGVLIESPPSPIKKILLTVDATPVVINECINKNVSYLISYHPIIFKGLKSINDECQSVRLCVQNGISVYCPHTALDESMNKKLKLLAGEGTVEEIADRLKSILKLTYVRLCGDKKRIYSDIIVGVGSGKFNNVSDCLIITGEMNHHNLLYYRGRGCSVLLLEHCNSERFYLDILKECLSDKLQGWEIMISEEDKSPIELL